MSCQAGHTWIESLIVLTLGGILAAGALPSLQQTLARRAAEADVQDLLSHLRVARMQAIQRLTRVSICASDDGRQCNRGERSRDWSMGWIVFVDGGTRGQVDGADAVLRVHQRLTRGGRIVSALTTPYAVSYLPVGIATGAQNHLRLLASADPRDDARIEPVGRLCISTTGGARYTQDPEC